MIPAGPLDRRLQLQRAVEERDPQSGEVVRTFLTHQTVWGSYEALAVREAFEASNQDAAFVDVRFQIRYRNDVLPGGDHRVIYDGRAYDIVGVREIGRREGLEILAETRGE